MHSTLSCLYGDALPRAHARCGFRQRSKYLTPGRRNAYLSSAAHLPGSDLRHSPIGINIRHFEDIHKTEAELASKLGYAHCHCLCAQ